MHVAEFVRIRQHDDFDYGELTDRAETVVEGICFDIHTLQHRQQQVAEAGVAVHGA